MKTHTAIFLALFVLSSAQAQDESQRPGFHEHDGFFLSFSLGPGYVNIEDKLDQVDYAATFSGLAAAVDIRIGGTIANNLILSGDIMGWNVRDPKIDLTAGGSATLEDDSFLLSMYGAGLTYYLEPSNIFFSGSVGIGSFLLKRDETSFRTDPGFSFFLKAGKEWWVGADWALGVAATFGWSSVKNSAEGISETLSGYSASVHFNVTFH